MLTRAVSGALPHEHPKWSTVKSFYCRAAANGIWEKAMQYLVRETRVNAGRNETPSYALIDSQSVKTAAGADNRGYDGGKTECRKRHTVTDIIGNILAVHIHAANIHDTKGGCYVFAKAKKLYPSIKAACADEGYRGTLSA